MTLLKTSMEDVAFKEWDGEKEVKKFVDEFFDIYPGFEDFWEKGELEKALV